MIRIKISTSNPKIPIIRQIPELKSTWGNYEFFVNTTINACDYWFIYDGLLQKETVSCPPENVILITAEPDTIRKYDTQFLKQFGGVITSQRQIEHPNVLLQQQGQTWDFGINYDKNSPHYLKYLSYEKIAQPITEPKEKTLSIIASNKALTPGHKNRLAFIDLLKKELGDSFDIFGARINHIADKRDAIVPYKYVLAIENSSIPHYWTEKLADVFLGEAYPIYYGCPNIYDYFPQESLTVIDINEPEAAIATIKKIIANNVYEKNKSAIAQAKKLILEKYNLFALMSKYAESHPSNSEKTKITLYPEKTNNFPLDAIRYVLRWVRHIKKKIQ